MGNRKVTFVFPLRLLLCAQRHPPNNGRPAKAVVLAPRIAADSRGKIAKRRNLAFIPSKPKLGLGHLLSRPIRPLFHTAATRFFYLQYLKWILTLVLPSRASSFLRPVLADLRGSFENGPDTEYPSQFVRCDSSQRHRRNTSTGRAIRISAKLTWSDLRLQVRRQCLGRLRENTILGALWWRAELANHRLRHIQLWKLLSQLDHVRDGPLPLLRAQDFRHFVPDLRRE